MSFTSHINRKWWIAGIIVAIVLVLLILLLINRYVQALQGEPGIGARSPVPQLGYCSPESSEVCITSFVQVVDGFMEVYFQIPHAYYPEFILVIDRYGVESTYECERVEDSPTVVMCWGAPHAPGELLQFKIISRNRGTLLAEGKLSIIGIALSTPVIVETPTETLTETPSATPTMTEVLPPTHVLGTPSPVGTPPSYPNPSYP